MPLQTYRRKRRFADTPEPAAGGKRGKAPIFVVQLHHASHRHYDFRLEVDGALKSWAVPKGPSLDPSVKRLAVEVEDHPLSYAKFSGDIPKGNYGAGHVDIFDYGTWQAEGSARADLKRGELKFVLHGKILRGSWVLVRTKREAAKPQWLLIKHHDEFSSKSEADDFVADEPKKPVAEIGKTSRRKKSASLKNGAFAPELCRTTTAPPAGDAWLHEAKWDGYRLLTTVVAGVVRLWSRNAIEWTVRLPEIVAAIRKLKLDNAKLDGELVVLDGNRADFNKLQARLAGENDATLIYMLFDAPYLDGESLRDVPLIERKQRLSKLLRKSKQQVLRFSEHHVGAGETVMQQAVAAGIEGIVSKRLDSPYRGGRNGDWIKIKARMSDEFAVIGFSQPQGIRSGIGALLLGKPAEDGFRYVGRVGTGFSAEKLRELRTMLDKNIVDKAPSDTSLLERKYRNNAVWVSPKLVVEVYFQGRGGNGLLRQPAFKTLREDKTVHDLSEKTSSKKTSAKAQPDKAQKAEPKRATPSTGEIEITHPERKAIPALNVTKQDVADYYSLVSAWLLPEIANRPLSVLRCPDGIHSACFFQKHAGKGWGEHIKSITIKEKNGSAEYLCIDDVLGLLELVQMNVLELHPWNTHARDLKRADRLVFDLDPHASVTWKRMVAAARILRKHLASIGLESFVRTSGGKGLHVVVPLRPTVAWAKVKAFAQAIAVAMSTLQPDEFVAVAGDKNRQGKIFIDWLRNTAGATSVASYSLRARDAGGVAMPLTWDELGKVKSGDAFTIRNVPARLQRRRGDPWAEFERIEQGLPKID
ncbi:DNA ligase D [Pseudolysobacter antarcticus]|uniref:DNA ligase (ATP) n=1 Tax=Pseudolysobacter antarcticus TaxID=2511995 RepID=A0A411HJA5_9GAMM|nr:DNA ligase D [Pseudolysobacter antarcticus]QBB70616.1 DNA ligase D [Pseudolysobacter antarcticus]